VNLVGGRRRSCRRWRSQLRRRRSCEHLAIAATVAHSRRSRSGGCKVGGGIQTMTSPSERRMTPWPRTRAQPANASGCIGSSRERREIQDCLWTVARPVTCALQPHRSTSTRQLTGLTPPPTGPTPARRLLGGDFYFPDPEYEHGSSTGGIRAGVSAVRPVDRAPWQTAVAAARCPSGVTACYAFCGTSSLPSADSWLPMCRRPGRRTAGPSISS
jgi:hypothetical protein